MNNLKTYKQIFMDIFSMGEDDINEETAMESVELWDSVGHVNLVATVEDTFNIEMTIEEMSEFTSFEAGKEILRNYGIDI